MTWYSVQTTDLVVNTPPSQGPQPSFAIPSASSRKSTTKMSDFWRMGPGLAAGPDVETGERLDRRSGRVGNLANGETNIVDRVQLLPCRGHGIEGLMSADE